MPAPLYDMLSGISFWLMLVGVSAIPYAMYPVAYLGESRRPGRGPNDVPVWRDQSRAFMPGDFGLALMVTCCLQLRSRLAADWAISLWFKGLVLLVAVGIFLAARTYLYTPKHYSRSAWNSPSKRYHDFVMFLLFGSVALYVCLPVYLTISWQSYWSVHLLGLFGLALWVTGNVYDFTHNETPSARQHPAAWTPIWRRTQ